MAAAAQKTRQPAHTSRSAANDPRSHTRSESAHGKGSFAENSSSPTVLQAKHINGWINGSAEREAESAADQVVYGSHASNGKPGITPVSLPGMGSAATGKNGQPSTVLSDPLPAGQGKPLDPDTREYMESRFGGGFGHIRVHTNNAAANLADSINARAITQGRDIYFNNGQYRPDTEEGRHLIAHELTHTIQQGAASGRTENNNVVQPSLFRRAASSVGSRLRGAAEWVGDRLNEGLRWLRNRLASMVSSMPGYGLFTVFLGRDPISGHTVQRSGRNFINHGLDVIPNGQQYKQKLEEEGALDEATAWIDAELAKLNLSASEIMGQFSRFWDSLGISDVRDPGGVFDRLIGIFSGSVNRIVDFAVNLARKFLEIVKNYLLSKLREFVENQESPTWYPLLTVILGHDPIMNEDVDRSGENILTGFIRLHPEGDDQLARMRETGSFQKAVDWIDETIIRIQNIASGLGNAFSTAWEAVTDISSLMDPVGTFTRIYQAFRTPIVELISFAVEVAAMIIRFVKDALLRRLSQWAQNTWGYPLLTVLLGKDPFTDEEVPRTPKNIIRGFILLLPGGEDKFNRLEETGAIDRMVSWISSAVESLNITFGYIVGLFTGLWQSFTLRDLAAPLDVFARIVQTFAEPIARILAFIWEVMKALVMFALEAMNFPFETIGNIVNNAMQAYEDIKRDPIGFFLNLLAAVKQGFAQFFDNILNHLLGGLRTWLFGELSEAGISPPTDLSFRSILGFVMDVLGITLSNVWARLAEKIGPERAQQIQSVIDQVSGAWAFVKDVYERGPIAIWEYIQGRLSNLWDMILEQIRNWIVTRIIERVTVRLLSMLDPSGIMAVVNSFIAFYNAVQSFIEKLREMLEIVNSFVAGVANVARGVISQAADYLERALADGIPVAISFLANQVGLRGLGSRVAEMIESARGYVNAAIDWLIDRALAAGSALLEMGRSAVQGIRDWIDQRRRVQTNDGHSHELFITETGSRFIVMIASSPQNYTSFILSLQNEYGLTDNDVNDALDRSREIDALLLQNVPENQQEAHDRQIQDKFEQLARLTAELPIPESEGSNPDPVYGPENNGFGTFARVEYRQSPHEIGGPPTVNNTDVFEMINLRRRGDGSFYVKGHLLNDNIGGIGDDWKNLTPLTRSANSTHESDFEQYPKEAVNGTRNRISSSPGEKKGHMSNFNVVAEYGRSVPSNVSQIANSESEELPSRVQSIDTGTLIRVIEAEQYVPRLLRCYVEIELENGQTRTVSTSIQNEINHGDLSHYEFGPDNRRDFRLSGYLEANSAIGYLTQLNGIDEEKAKTIIASYESIGRMHNYQRQIQMTRAQLEELNPEYRIKR